MSPDRRSRRRARRNETWVYLSNRPFAYAFARLTRHLGPAVHIPLLGTFVNDPHVARAALGASGLVQPGGPGGIGEFLDRAAARHGPLLFNQTGQEHRELRRTLLACLDDAAVAAATAATLAPDLAEFFAALGAGERRDFATFFELAVTRLVWHLLGLPPDTPSPTIERVARLGSRISDSMRMGTPRLGGARAARLQAMRAEVDRTLFELTVAPRPAARPTSPLCRLREAGMSDQDAVGLIALLLMAGTETLVAGVPRIVALLIDSDCLGELVEHPERIDPAVDEGLRLTAPSPVVLQGVVADGVAAGVKFRAGRRFVVVLFNILRDARWVEDPYAFRLDRRPDDALRNLWFGAGPHYCLGAGLARSVIGDVLRALAALPRAPLVRRRRPTHGKSFPGYARLELSLTAPQTPPRSG